MKLVNTLPIKYIASLEAAGAFIRQRIIYLGGLSKLTAQVVKKIFQRPFITADLKEQCLHVGLASMPIAAITLFFVGVVFAFQFGFTLRTLGAVQFIGRVTTVSMFRELAPVFTALVVGGRVGAGMAAELGSMRVSEQIDAIRALGADPLRTLIVPRVLAATFMIPIVTLFAALIGEIGAIFVCWAEFRVSPLSFYTTSLATVKMIDFFSGFTKTFFFGFGIAMVGCFEGLFCDFGTKGVGRATTRAVVNVSLVIVFTDFLLTRIFAFFL
ncbi:MAG TPA: ABC transporter permease [Myxococcota bacterium]|nr:ABC transporter permease [Myxococcota bacterium]